MRVFRGSVVWLRKGKREGVRFHPISFALLGLSSLFLVNLNGEDFSFSESGIEPALILSPQARPGGVILLRSQRVPLVPGRLEVISHNVQVEKGVIHYELTLRNLSREEVEQRVDVKFFDDGYSQEYAKHPQVHEVVLSPREQKVITGQVDFSRLSPAIRGVRLGVRVMPGQPQSGPASVAALWARAKVVRVSAGAGEWIRGGFLTLLVDPVTQMPAERVSVPSGEGVAIPAFYKNPWTEEIGLFLLVPVRGTSNHGQYQQRGDKSAVLIPDAGHPGEVTQRSYQISGRREGRRVSRLLSVYEVVAFTSKDALCSVEGTDNLAIEEVGWADRGGSYQFVKAVGTSVGTPTAEPMIVQVGERFRVHVPVTVVEGKTMVIRAGTRMGSPSFQEKTVRESGVVEFSVQATQSGTVRVDVLPLEYQSASPAQGFDTPGIQNLSDPVECPGAPLNPPEGTTPIQRSDGGHGLRQWTPLLVGGVGVLINTVRVRTEREQEMAFPVVTLGEDSQETFASVVAFLQDGVKVDGNTQDSKPCPERIKGCPCKHEWCGCPPKTLACDTSYECDCTGTPHKESCRCKLEGAPQCTCPDKETTRCSVLYRGTAISAIHKPCGNCDPKCTHNANPGCSAQWKTIKKVMSAAQCAMAGAVAGSVCKPFLGTLIGGIAGAVVCALIDEWVTEEWCTNDGKICAKPGHSKCGCACESHVRMTCNCGRKGCACKVGCHCGGS